MTAESLKDLYPPIPDNLVIEPFTAFFFTIGVTFGLTGIITAAIIFLTGSVLKHKHTISEKLFLFYLVLSTLIHFNLERYWTFHSKEILNEGNNNIFARLWRHFGISDTRWLGPQPGVPLSQFSCMYGIEVMATFGCGPFCLLTIILYILNLPAVWVTMPVATTIEAYGLMITWIPQVYENHQAVPVKDPVLYFLYFIGMQLPWIVVPVISIFYSIFRVTKLAGDSKPKDNNKPKKIKNDADKKKINTPKDKKNK